MVTTRSTSLTAVTSSINFNLGNNQPITILPSNCLQNSKCLIVLHLRLQLRIMNSRGKKLPIPHEKVRLLNLFRYNDSFDGLD